MHDSMTPPGDRPPRLIPVRTIEPIHRPTRFMQWAVVLLFLALAASWVTFLTARPFRTPSDPPPVVPRADLADDEKTTIQIYQQTKPSVAYITTTQQGFARGNVTQVAKGTGSGFIWDHAGHVVTNYHVLAGADAAYVTLSDDSQWRARTVGTAPDFDLAVLRIEAPVERLHRVLVGRSHDLLVGQKVFAIGSPFELDQSLTTGIISALHRQIKAASGRVIQDVIQTDAAINPGNSGGPLLDSAGRLIGVNTAIYSPSGANAGIGFAVPVDTVAMVVQELIATGKWTRRGLQFYAAPDSILRRRGRTGVLVGSVMRGGEAERAGLRSTRRDRQGNLVLGDIIVSVNGRTVANLNDLWATLQKYDVGEEITLGLMRDGQSSTLKLRLQALD